MSPSCKQSGLPLFFLFVLGTSALVPANLRAGPPCFPAVSIAGWSTENVGGFANGSSELQAQEYKLCSDSIGFGPSDDSVRYVFKGTGDDFYITVRVDDFNAPGLGGLMVRQDPQRTDSAFIAIYVQFQAAPGNFVINSSFRPDGGTLASLDVGPAISTGLPVYLKISRTGGVLTTSFSPNGNNYANHIQAGGPLTDLAASSVTAGLVQSSQNPLATSTAYFSNPLIVALGKVGSPIDLGDVVAGGDGSGTAPAGNVGIDPRNGLFATSYIDGPLTESDAVADGLNPSPTSSPFIDSVFFIRELRLPGTAGVTHDPITQSGIVYEFSTGDIDTGTGWAWNNILKDRNGGISVPPVTVGGNPFSSSVGISAAMGVTFDLDALRDRHGPEKVGCFQTYWGLSNCAGGDAHLYAILSGESTGAFLVRTAHFTSGQGAFMDPIEIPTFAKYLTLATGMNGVGYCDTGTFARAWITESPCLTPSFVTLSAVDPGTISTSGGTPITLTGENFAADQAVLVGGLPMTNLSFPDPQHIRGRTPALPAGRYAVEVTRPAATGGVLARLADAVEAVAPSRRPSCGGVFPAAADASIVEAQPFANFGSGPLAVARQGTGEEHALVRFDLASAVPSASTIWSARLELTLFEAAVPESYTLLVGDVTEAWSEASVTWSTRPTVVPGLASLTSGLRRGVVSVDVTALVTSWLTGGSSVHSLTVMPGSPMSMTFHERVFPGGGPDPDGPRLAIRCSPVFEAPPADPAEADALQQAGLDRLRAASRRPLDLRFERGAARFAAFDLPVPPEAARDDLAKAEWFLEEYSGLLRTANPQDTWQLVRRAPEIRALFFRQLHQGVPVFPAEVGLFLSNGGVLSLSGNYVPEITLPSKPRLSTRDAEKLAVAYFFQRNPPGAGRDPAPVHVIGDSQLRYINMGLLGDPDPTTRLAWQVNVEAGGQQAGLFIDAHAGGLIYEQARSRNAFDLELRDRFGNASSCSANGTTLLYTETGPVVQNPSPEAAQAFANISEVYNYYKGHFGRDSYDNKGKTIWMFLNVDFSGELFDAHYLSSCGIMEFGTGVATRDIVAHEFTHGVIQYTCDLEYSGQSGALNESLADIFGHFVDNDDWTVGEDSPGGVRIDLSDPPAKGYPDHMSKYNPNHADALHWNGTIHSKAAYLIIAGGVFNGRSITGLGQAKAEQLFYWTMRALGTNFQFIDVRDMAIWAAEEFVKAKYYGFTLADVCSVKNAYAAVGLGIGDADCDGVPDVQESDADGDGKPDNLDNCPFTWNPGQANFDKDGMGDACDPDDDDDGVPDVDANGKKLDNCRLAWNPGQEDWNNNKIGDACEDSDGDGVVDAKDNCREIPNSDQRNTDCDLAAKDPFLGDICDELGDACDPDIDGDGKPNVSDNCPLHFNPDQKDSDGDTVGDACDLCPGVSDPDNGDPDGDGLGNPCDPDDDNDGILDDGDGSGVIGDHPCKGGVTTNCDDNCREVPNPDQFDGDSNGIGIVCDCCELNKFLQDSIYHLQISLLPLPDPTSVVLSVCPTCGPADLAEGFTSIVHLETTVPVVARVVDSNGIIVASPTEAGTSLSLAFEPVPYGATSQAGGGPQGGGGAGGAGGGGQATSLDLAPSKIRYRVQIIPVEPTDPSQLYPVTIQIEERVPRKFIRGDANQDGKLDLSDAIAILSYLFLGTAAPPCLDAADANDDAEVDIADGIRVLLYLFAGVPLPPGTTPGVPQKDPTPDSLGCEG